MVLNSNLFWNPIITFMVGITLMVNITFMGDTSPPSKAVELVMHQNLQVSLFKKCFMLDLEYVFVSRLINLHLGLNAD